MLNIRGRRCIGTSSWRSNGRRWQIERWYCALQQRDAYRTHIMIPLGELRGRLDY